MDNISHQFEDDGKNIQLSNNKKYNLTNKITIKDCDFSYNESNKILDNLNFDFKLGRIYGVKGPSGGGKTTLLNILTGLLMPSKGDLYADNQKITKQNIKEFQNIIGYVPQNTFLFDASILENITFDFSDEKTIDHEKIKDLLKHLSLIEKINSLKNGLNTNVGERGVNLSGGQIQRIGLARAMYNNPKILILDESTNAIEKDIERKVLSYLKSIKKYDNNLSSSQRYNVEYADQVLELVNGNLIKIK